LAIREFFRSSRGRAIGLIALFLGLPLVVEALAYAFVREEYFSLLERTLSSDGNITNQWRVFVRMAYATTIAGIALAVVAFYWKKTREMLSWAYLKRLSGNIKALVASSIFIILLRLFVWESYPDLFREDGLLENGTALLFLAAGLQVGIRAWFAKGRRNSWYILIAILLLLIGMEEISWGQRIIGWTTPQWLAGVNQQGETNLHNLVSNRYLNQIFSLLFGYLLIAGLRKNLLNKPALAQVAQTMPGEEYAIMGLIFVGLFAISFRPLGTNELIEAVLALFAFSYSFSVPAIAEK